MTEFLTPLELKRLKEHKYSATGISYLEPYMQVFWRWLVEQVPLSWAPNSITTAGLIANVLSTLILVYYSPDGYAEAPRWCYFLCAFCLFIYQSLDAIDGKQARRTKTNTPLGELFDHGCDSVSTVFVVLGTLIALRLGHEPGWFFFEFFSALFLYYLAHWQAYVSGTLRFGKLDVTEGQWTVMIIHMICTIFGPGFWDAEVAILGCTLKMIPVYFGIFGAVLQCQANFSVIFFEGGIGKNGSTVAGTSTIFPSLPITLMIAFALAIYQKSGDLYENNPCLYTIAFGLVIAKVTNRLVVANMTKSEMDLWDTSYIGPLLLIINQYFNCPVNEYIVLWICLIYSLINLLRYSTSVCQQICDYLNIYCFDITSRPRPEPDTNSSKHQ